jgi:hypothetical protein
VGLGGAGWNNNNNNKAEYRLYEKIALVDGNILEEKQSRDGDRCLCLQGKGILKRLSDNFLAKMDQIGQNGPN